MNVVLTGMPGSGKSTVGVLLAKVLGLDFVDTDLLLQRRERRSLAQILAERGSAGFLAVEDELLSSLTFEETVIATGGSAVYHERGMARLQTLGPVVWIDVPLEELARRLGDMEARGVVLAPGQTLAGLFHERRPLYQRWADHRLAVSQESLETTVERARRLVREQRA